MTLARANPALNFPAPLDAMPRRLNRRVAIVLSVLGLHVLAVWALQSGLLRRAMEIVIPVQVLAELIEPPQPVAEPPPPAPVVAAPTPPKPRPRPVPQPQPQPVAAPEPMPLAPVVPVAPPAPPAPPEPIVAAAPPPAPPAPPAPPRIELPSSNADYLKNPPPPYPPMSKRLGEQGRVVVRAFIQLDGTASRAEVQRSSGFERLDQTAVQTVLRWRYVPGKRAGVPEAMWFNIPINFVLE
ncbi:energy transducer TonB [Hydrogenophaga sp. IBVHS1]|uniref:energy transducer TonB n=1 Tax=unclassified Hydrogenophaga TaxID=2610897 RepID=UPI0026BA5260